MNHRIIYFVLYLVVAGCGAASRPNNTAHPVTPDGAPQIDRFSAAAGHLLVRDKNPALPAAGAPVDFDRPPFLTQALGPAGHVVRYYNFDVQPPKPMRRYRLTHRGEHAPIAGELDIIDAIPGDAGYNDFAKLVWVEVPADFKPGSITTAAQAIAAGATESRDGAIVNCPVVPRGSSARGSETMKPPTPTDVWYRGKRVSCLEFPGVLTPEDGNVPTSPIYVTFGAEQGAGFVTEGATPPPALAQTHNVVFSVPGDADYSPLWAVHIYNRSAFASVHDANSASAAPLVNEHGPLVNCPIIYVAPTSADR
jgi:hypothetical protein